MTDTTDQLIERLQEEYDIDDIDEQGSQIYDYLTKGKLGPHTIYNGFSSNGKHRKTDSNGLSMTGRSKIKNLAVQFGESKRIYNEAGNATTQEEIDRLRGEARGLIFRQSTVTDFIDVKEQEIKIAVDTTVNDDIQDTEQEIESVESETSRLEDKKEELTYEINQTETYQERTQVESKLIDVELTIEEREAARQRLLAKLKEMQRKRGRS